MNEAVSTLTAATAGVGLAVASTSAKAFIIAPAVAGGACRRNLWRRASRKRGDQRQQLSHRRRSGASGGRAGTGSYSQLDDLLLHDRWMTMFGPAYGFATVRLLG